MNFAILTRPALCLAFVAAMALAPSQALAAPEGDDPPLRYTVQKGDTLFALAESYFRSPAGIETVRRLNRVADARRLPVGKSLVIPRDVLRYTSVDVSIVAFSGPVRIADQTARIGRVVKEREAISTGANGFVSLSTKFGGRFSIPSNSRARLVSARRYLLGETLDIDLAIERGRGTTSSPRLKGSDRIRVRTPVAVTAVRGTEFRVAYDEDGGRNLTEVVEGTVAVAAGANETTAQAGFGVATDGSLAAPEKLLPIPQMEEPGRIQTDEVLRFGIEPASDEAGYRFQIAKDAGFLDVVAEEVVAMPEATFAELEDGRYFVRARAISGSGLEGLAEATSFRRKRLGAQGSVGGSDDGEGYLFQWLPEGEGNTFYAFQLWRTDAPGRLMVDETSLSTTGLELAGFAPAVYEWRVAAIQADADDGLIKVWGPTQKLTISE